MVKIKSISVYNGEGESAHYFIGKNMNGMVIRSIRKVSEYINGDPFNCYNGYDGMNKVFSINAYCHCLIEYTKSEDNI